MSIFSSPSFDQHELVAFTEDPHTGLKAIIAVHNSNLGAALGGCRMYPYANDSEALEDVLRLSRGMTYKSALAGLPMGGGKAVIIGNPHTDKTEELLESMGRFIDTLGGKYITAEDSGTSVADMKIIARNTEFASGINDKDQFGGDPSPYTAFGIYCGIKAALRHKTGNDNLNNKRIAVQGAGVVGRYLIEQLVWEGAKVFVADIHQGAVEKARSIGATPVSTDEILKLNVDVLAPCAMGAILNDQSIPELNTRIIAGGANNQLAETRHGDQLRKKGILYAPDFVINAGGIIHIHHQHMGHSSNESREQIEKIGDTLLEIFETSDELSCSTVKVAEQLAESRFKKARPSGKNSKGAKNKQAA